MTDRPHRSRFLPRFLPHAGYAALLALAAGLGGCAGLGDGATSVAFADPAKYDLWDCKQLETERKSLAVRIAELDGLIAKAQTGTGGAVMAEIGYRNSYITLRAQAKLADEVWARNKCVSAPTPPPPAAVAAPPRPGHAKH
ncbi:MAG TPA: twin-arginine translocation pathway signal [Rhodopseudomonas sp.]|uniref:twin-arginine translocation pathway signal n=1 Tax=Rhodopseudomonas sp. TaxID=1078 RepID=UPI002ED8254E